jgi:hypothetical protein
VRNRDNKWLKTYNKSSSYSSANNTDHHDETPIESTVESINFVVVAHTDIGDSEDSFGSKTSNTTSEGVLGLLFPGGEPDDPREIDRCPWSVYVLKQHVTQRPLYQNPTGHIHNVFRSPPGSSITEYRIDPGLSADPRGVVEAHVAHWFVDGAIKFLVPSPIMSDDRPVFITDPAIGWVRPSNFAKETGRRKESHVRFEGPYISVERTMRSVGIIHLVCIM